MNFKFKDFELSTKRLINGSVNAISGSLLDRLGQFFLSIIVSRYVGVDAFSFYSLLISYAAFLVAISSQSISVVISRNCAIDSKIDTDRVIGQILLGFCSIPFLFIIVFILFKKFQFIDDPVRSYSDKLQLIFYFSVFFQCIYVYITNLHRGFENFSIIRNSIALKNVITIPLSLTIVYFHTIEYLIFYFFISNFLSLCVIILKSCRFICFNNFLKYFKYEYLAKINLKNVFLLSLPFLIVTVSTSFYNYKIKDFLYGIDDGSIYLAAYSVVVQFSTIFTLIVGSVGFSSLPLFAESNDHNETLLPLFNKYYLINAAVILVPLFVFVLFSKLLLSIYSIDTNLSGFSSVLFVVTAYSTLVWTIGPFLLAKASGYVYMMSMLIKIFITLTFIYFFKSNNVIKYIPLILFLSDFSSHIFYTIYFYVNKKIFLFNKKSFCINLLFIVFFIFTYANWHSKIFV